MDSGDIYRAERSDGGGRGTVGGRGERGGRGGLGVGPGGASVVTIFVVLCLAVFAALSLLTARYDLALSEKAADSTAAYYSADAEAARWVNSLDKTSFPDGSAVEKTFPIDGRRELYVSLRSGADGIAIEAWQVRTQERVYDDSLPVWNP